MTRYIRVLCHRGDSLDMPRSMTVAEIMKKAKERPRMRTRTQHFSMVQGQEEVDDVDTEASFEMAPPGAASSSTASAKKNAYVPRR